MRGGTYLSMPTLSVKIGLVMFTHTGELLKDTLKTLSGQKKTFGFSLSIGSTVDICDVKMVDSKNHVF